MDPDAIAAVAALAVAFVALLAASAQAIQQYLVSGQLIRLCDSVVYNQMPGQGRRIWQFSQFRFRVVYSIPQVHLLPDLWLRISSHVRPLPPDAAPLPDLKVHGPNSTSAALAGEASWVSFVRAAQHSAGRSLRYVMVEGDADRCPSDLPVVPMQLSMRDVVAMALMAGMECTDVSFPSQSISMQGDAGTITSSRHPVLGALIHYAPKQATDSHGIRVLDGTIQGEWTARLLDIVTVAGHRYDLVDRKHYEEDEGSWMKASSDRSLILDRKPGITSDISPRSTLRRRRPMHGIAAELDNVNPTTEDHDPNISTMPLQYSGQADPLIVHRQQDGKWRFVSKVVKPVADDTSIPLPTPAVPMPRRGSSVRFNDTLKKIRRQLLRARRPTPRDTESILPVSEQIRLRSQPDEAPPIPLEIKSDLKSSGLQNSLDPDKHTGDQGKHPQDHILTPQPERGEQLGGEENPPRPSSHRHPAKARTPLLLTNGITYAEHPNALPEGLVFPKLDREVLRDQTRHEFVVDKWQETFQQRQKERSRGRSQNDRDRRAASRLHSARAPGRQRSLNAAQKAKLGESVRQRKLAIEEPRRASGSNSSPDKYSLVSGRKQSTQFHKSSYSEHSREKSSDRRYRRNKSYRGTDSLSISPTLELYDGPVSTHNGVGKGSRDSIFGGASPPENGAPIERGRRRNSELYTPAAGSDKGLPSHVNGSPRTHHGSPLNPVRFEYKPAYTSMERDRKRVRVLDPPQYNNVNLVRNQSNSSLARGVPPHKPALRSPTERFPEDPDFVRPGVALSEEFRRSNGIPEGARWTKIDRRVVFPEVLERSRERYVEREDDVIVLRPLSLGEIEQYAKETQSFRAKQRMPSFRDGESQSESGDEASSVNSDDSQGSFVRLRDLEAGKLSPVNSDPDRQTMQPDSRKPSADKDTKEMSRRSTRPAFGQGRTDAHETESSEDRYEHHSFSATNSYGPKANLLPKHNLQPANRQRHKDSFFNDPSERRTSSVGIRGRRSISRHKSLRDEGILTYAEEILFLRSDEILKNLMVCTERCKDVATTLKFVRSVQPELTPNVLETYSLIKEINTSVKSLLFHLRPLREHKEMASIVTMKLDTLLLGLQTSLDVLQTSFDLFDITPLTSDEREEAWKRTSDLFEKRCACTMGEYLGILRSFSGEVVSNLQAGVFTSPEAELLKKRLSEANLDSQTTPKSARRPESLSRRHTSQSRSKYFHSPSRFTDSPLGSPMNSAFRNPDLYDKVSGDNSRQRPRWPDLEPKEPKKPNVPSSVSTSSSYSMTDTDDSSGSETDTSSTTLSSSKSNYTGEMKWFWICQADVLPGYFATPWKGVFSGAECIGTISVLLKSLQLFTNETNFQYVAVQCHNREWLQLGKTTYPSYAHNAAGGVVVAGTYRATSFQSFKNPIAPLELLNCYEHQVDRNFSSSAQGIIDSTAELMGLDTWLSISGRQPEIMDGPSHLLRALPTLIQQIETDFSLEFSSVDRTSKDGGSRIINTISDSLLAYLNEENLSDAEQLFCLVALLRTAKMALCVARGTDTAMLRDVLVRDVQVYLA
ncbi:MAG: hypothetical protein Q9171_002503 [Xanthocarpia ochracea]